MTNISTAPKKTGKAPGTKKEVSAIGQNRVNYYNRTYDGSPVFTVSHSQISPQNEVLIDIEVEKPAADKYGNMTNFLITNNSNSDLEVFINQDRTRILTVPSGTVRQVDEEELNGGLHSYIVKNNDAGNTINAGEVKTEFYKKPITGQQFFRQTHKKITKLFTGA